MKNLMKKVKIEELIKLIITDIITYKYGDINIKRKIQYKNLLKTGKSCKKYF